MDPTEATLDERRDAAVAAAAAAIEERLRLYGNGLAVLAYEAIITSVGQTLSKTFLAQRDLDPKHFVRIRGRRRNRDYDAGYRMGMEDAARYARGDYACGESGVSS